MRLTLPVLTLFIGLCAGLTPSANAQVVSQFTFESPSILTAAVGSNASSVSSAATLAAPGNVGGHGVAPNGSDINLVVPGAEFEIPGLDISIDFVRAENTASFFILGGMDIGINTGAIYAKFQLNNSGSPANISLANFLTVPSDANFHTYRFIYDNVSGKFTAYLDGVLKYTNAVGSTGEQLYWVGATTATIGSGMNGNGATSSVLDNFIAQTPLNVLAVHLISFDVINDNGAAELTWSTATAADNFIIERSTDGINFTPVGTVAAEPGPDPATYHFTDNLPAPTNFYRLKITATDGNLTYSSICKLSLAATGFTISCYPNPVVNYATIRLDNAAPETVRLSIMTLDGRLLRSGEWTANPGQDLNVDLTTAPKGILLVTLQRNNVQQTTKILKK